MSKAIKTEGGFYFDRDALSSVSGEDLAIAFGVDDEDLFDDADDAADLCDLLDACARGVVDDGNVFASSTEQTRAARRFKVAE
jgi:hypothetical protein